MVPIFVAKQWAAVYDGHEIRVVNHLLSGCKLYVDGECRDINKQAVAWSARIPRLTAEIGGPDGEVHTVKVFAKSGFFAVRASIRVDGEHVGGDVL